MSKDIIQNAIEETMKTWNKRGTNSERETKAMLEYAICTFMIIKKKQEVENRIKERQV